MAGTERLFAPAFRYQRLGRLFVAITVIMVYIATFAMAAEAGLSSLGLTRGEDLQGRLTVEIPAPADESATSQDSRIDQALAVLRAVPGVARAAPLSDADIARLLKPWISDPDLIAKLPLPALIDVQRAPGAALTADALEAKLKPVAPGAQVEDQAAWLGDVAQFIKSLAVLAGVMIVLTGLALVIAIGLICRAVMATERETVTLLHIMGASDAAIAGHFQYHALRLARGAAALGFVLALLSLAALLFALRHVIDLGAMPLWREVELILLLILVPLAAIGAAVLAARHTVFALLHTA
ncbi:MAG TPA: hypothetical protein VMV79_05195 [Alphaproteobacteria bacterium]|nr:hypothetical protein [Alphaproteobacteria bacterium]